LWLLDEPATALDADGVSLLDGVLRNHLAGGGRVVLSSHGEVTGSAAVLDLMEFRPSGQDLAA
jgi:heme exporter protein A